MSINSERVYVYIHCIVNILCICIFVFFQENTCVLWIEWVRSASFSESICNTSNATQLNKRGNVFV